MLRPSRSVVPVGALVGLAALLASVAASGQAGSRTIAGLVVRIVDGDTIHVRIDGRTEKVRYIGINTPEIHHPVKGEQPGGRDAARLNSALTLGKRVRLELDVEERDRYRRLLAYVWVDDVMVNAELVCRGYAEVMTVPPNVRYQHLFLRHEREARESGRGLWRRSARGSGGFAMEPAVGLEPTTC